MWLRLARHYMAKKKTEEPLTRENKKAWAEYERRTRQEMEDILRATHGDKWMEANREEIDRELSIRERSTTRLAGPNEAASPCSGGR